MYNAVQNRVSGPASTSSTHAVQGGNARSSRNENQAQVATGVPNYLDA